MQKKKKKNKKQKTKNKKQKKTSRNQQKRIRIETMATAKYEKSNNNPRLLDKLSGICWMGVKYFS